MQNNYSNSKLTTTTFQIDLKKIFSRIIRYWWLFVLGVGIAWVLSFIFLKRITPKYTSRAVLLISEAGRSGAVSSQDILSVNENIKQKKSMENEIQILQSLDIFKKVVQRLQLHDQASQSSIDEQANEYRFQVTTKLFGNPFTSSMLELTLTDKNPQIASDVLNTLMEVYSEETIGEKNKVITNTLALINGRIDALSTQLDSIENDIQQFKSTHAIMQGNVSSSRNYASSEVRTSLQQLADYEVQLDLLASLENLLSSNNASISLIPATPITENPAFASLVASHNALVVQNKQMALAASEKNPSRIELEKKITDTRNFLLQTIQTQKKSIQIPVASIQRNLQSLQDNMSNVPLLEKQLVEKTRTQTAKEKLYLFLLQKREEMILSQAATSSTTKIIERAIPAAYPSSPKRKLIQSASLALGVLFPLLYVLGLGFFNTRVDDLDTVQQLVSLPILGQIIAKKGSENIVINKNRQAAINELFRNLRMKLTQPSQKGIAQRIIISSMDAEEGKTFITANLGITLALAKKRVLLIDLNLRKPKLASFLKVANDDGVTTFLSNNLPKKDLIKQHPTHDYLYYITSGPTPTNPSELIASDDLFNLLESISSQFDYILIDTPPVGWVADALILKDWVSKMLIVVRDRYTSKQMLNKLEIMHQQKELPTTQLIFNDAKSSQLSWGNFFKNKKNYYA